MRDWKREKWSVLIHLSNLILLHQELMLYRVVIKWHRTSNKLPADRAYLQSVPLYKNMILFTTYSHILHASLTLPLKWWVKISCKLLTWISVKYIHQQEVAWCTYLQAETMLAHKTFWSPLIAPYFAHSDSPPLCVWCVHEKQGLLICTYKVAWLSQHSFSEMIEEQSRSLNKKISHLTSQQARVIDLYSSSAEDLATTCYFLAFWEIREVPNYAQKPEVDFLVVGGMREVPNYAQKPEVDFLVVGQLAQSALQKMQSDREAFDDKKIPRSGVWMRCLRTLIASW